MYNLLLLIYIYKIECSCILVDQQIKPDLNPD